MHLQEQQAMPLETIPIQSIWSIFRHLPALLLRHYFTPTRLAGLIYVDLLPRHNSAEINLGQGATISLWLQVINLSPFPVELDRASFRFWCCGTIVKMSILNKQTIKPGEVVALHTDELIPDSHADQISRNITEYSCALEGNIEFNSKVRSFAKNLGHLDGINPRVLNARVRLDA